MDSCPSRTDFIGSHLLYDPNRIHEQPGSACFFVSEVCVEHPFAESGDREVLANRARQK